LLLFRVLDFKFNLLKGTTLFLYLLLKFFLLDDQGIDLLIDLVDLGRDLLRIQFNELSFTKDLIKLSGIRLSEARLNLADLNLAKNSDPFDLLSFSWRR
jgi:hypothetical protein